MKTRNASPRSALKENKMFIFILIGLGQIASILGSALTGFAVRVWAFENTGSVMQFALIAFFYTLPGIVVAPLAGVLIDRWKDRRKALILSDVAAGVSTGAIFLLVSAGHLEVWHLYVSSAIMSISYAIQRPAYISTTALLVPKEQLGRANGLVQIGVGASQIIAPFFGGYLLVRFGLPTVTLIDLCTLGAALLIMILVFIPKPTGESDAEERTLSKDMGYGWNYVKARPGLMGLLIFWVIIGGIESMVIVLIAPLVLGFGDAITLGGVSSVAGIGMLLGAISMAVWGGPKRRIHGVLGFTILRGFILFLGGLQPNAVLVAAAASIYLFCSQITGGTWQAIWQTKVPSKDHGRVFAVQQMFVWAAVPLGQILAGPLADNFFQPLLEADGAFANSVGVLIGTGPGRGIGLLLITLGLITLAVGIIGYAYPHLRLVEDELEDAIEDDEEELTVPQQEEKHLQIGQAA